MAKNEIKVKLDVDVPAIKAAVINAYTEGYSAGVTKSAKEFLKLFKRIRKVKSLSELHQILKELDEIEAMAPGGSDSGEPPAGAATDES